MKRPETWRLPALGAAGTLLLVSAGCGGRSHHAAVRPASRALAPGEALEARLVYWLPRTTLAVKVHEKVSQESLHLAAMPALAIVVTGLLPVIVLTRSITRQRWRSGVHG